MPNRSVIRVNLLACNLGPPPETEADAIDGYEPYFECEQGCCHGCECEAAVREEFEEVLSFEIDVSVVGAKAAAVLIEHTIRAIINRAPWE